MFELTPRAFWLPTLYSGSGMFLASFLWHGYVLSDLREIQNDLNAYFAVSILGYVLLGLLMSTLMLGLLRFKWIDDKENPLPKMMFAGMAVGVLLGCSLVALSLPMKGRFEPLHVWMDLAWQVVEQGLGGMLCAAGVFQHRLTSAMEREGA